MGDSCYNNTSLSLVPEILSKDELILYIKMRCQSIARMADMDHGHLVALYRKMLLPLPQREYRQNWYGKLLTEKRLKSGLQSIPEKNANIKSMFSSSTSTLKRAAPAERLKPPPEVSTSSRIRLSSSTLSASHSRNVDSIAMKDENGKVAKEDTYTTTKKRSEEPSAEVSKPKRVKITWP